MIKSSKKPIVTMSGRILKKIKNLSIGKVYSYSDLGHIGDKERVVISRIADRGVIVKAGRGKFFKPGRSVYKRSDKTVAIDKSMFTHDLFWSISDGAEVSTELMITKYVESPYFKDIAALCHLFSYTRVLESALKVYSGRTSAGYQRVRTDLETCARWSIS